MKNDELPEQELSEFTQDPVKTGEIVIGTFNGFHSTGEPLVNFAENPSDNPLPAIATVALEHQNAGRQVGLLFAESDWSKPIIIGFIHSPLHEMLESFELTAAQQTQLDEIEENTVPNSIDDVTVDGQRVVIEGKDEIVFKCGEASITLTKAGKILIRGKYLLNRSSGVNRIMGGSVQVN